MTRRRMLCSGTGGPRKNGPRGLTCPPCRQAGLSPYPATPQGVPPPFGARAARPLPEPQRRAIEQPAVHLHLYGVSAEDIAGIIGSRSIPARRAEEDTEGGK